MASTGSDFTDIFNLFPLRYLFGEIMYGGHITDDWDRRLCKTYLEEYMNQALVGFNPLKLSSQIFIL